MVFKKNIACLKEATNFDIKYEEVNCTDSSLFSKDSLIRVKTGGKESHYVYSGDIDI